MSGSIVVSYATVDKEDYEKINKYQWRVEQYGDVYYPRTFINKKKVTMHRLVLSELPNENFNNVYHKNGSVVDNRKCNLRYTCEFIAKYRSNYIGLVLDDTGRWKAYYDKQYISTFVSEFHAAAAYNIIALQIEGENATINSGITNITTYSMLQELHASHIPKFMSLVPCHDIPILDVEF